MMILHNREVTMGLPTIFKYESKDIRIVTDEQGDPWWVAKDVADYLGIEWKRSATIAHIPEEWKGADRVATPGGIQEMITLSEQGLYFFLARSDKPKALPFQKWIVGEVLPSIRKTGGYSLAIPKTLPDALRAYALEIERRQEIEAKLAIAAPKAEFFDAVADSKDAVDLGRAAKVLNCGIGRNRLFQILRDRKILMETNIPYQAFVDRGYFRVIEQKYTKPDGSTHITFKTLVYQRGLAYIQKTLKAA